MNELVRHTGRTSPPGLSLGELLRAHRLDAGLSQAELAARLDLPPLAVANFERSEQVPTLDQLNALITVLGLSAEQNTELRRHHATAPRPRPNSSSPRVWSAPGRNAHFTGRDEELAGLHSALAGGSRAVVLPVALHGLGGVGKTQLALEYAHRFKAEYELVWWVDAEQLELIDVSLAQLGESLGLGRSGSVPADARHARDALRRGEPHARWLVIFDNAAEPEDLLPYLPDCGDTGHLLITSRDQSWARIVTSLQVDVFARAESIARLTSGVPGLAAHDAETIAELVGDLPLAVESATAWLSTTGTPVHQYRAALAAEGTRVLELEQPHGYSTPVSAVWSVAIARLRASAPAAAHLLELASCMSPDGIATELMTSPEAIVALRRVDERVTDSLSVGALVRAIVRLSLMHADANELRVHRLVQDVVRSQIVPEMRSETIHKVHRILTDARPPEGEIDNPDSWPRYARIWPHLAPSKAAICDEEPVRELMIDRVRFLRHIGEYQRALEFGRLIEDQWIARIPEIAEYRQWALELVRQLLKLRTQIANVLRSQGKLQQAYDLDVATLAQQQEDLSQHHLDALATATGLAADLRALGEYSRALDMDQRTYSELKDLLGDNHPRTLSAANNLAASYRLIGDVHRAHEIDRATLAKRAATLGPLHPDTLWSNANIGLDQAAIGQYTEAVGTLSQALSTRTEIMGQARPGTLRTAVSLAWALCKTHRQAEALALAQETHAIYTSRHDATNPDVLLSALTLASALSANNQHTEAVDTARSVWDRLRQGFGAQHPVTFGCMNNLAIYMRRDGAHDDARNRLERAAEGLTDRLGPQHPATCAARTNLASCMARAGDLIDAEQLERSSILGLTTSLGPEHPDALATMWNLANTLHRQGRKREARQLRQSASRQLTTLAEQNRSAILPRINQRLDLEIHPTPF